MVKLLCSEQHCAATTATNPRNTAPQAPPETLKDSSRIRKITHHLGKIAQRLGIVAQQLGKIAQRLGINAQHLGKIVQHLGIIAQQLGINAQHLGKIAPQSGINAQQLGTIAQRPIMNVKSTARKKPNIIPVRRPVLRPRYFGVVLCPEISAPALQRVYLCQGCQTGQPALELHR